MSMRVRWAQVSSVPGETVPGMPLRALYDDEPVISTLVDDDRWAALRTVAKKTPDALRLPGCRLPCYPRRSAKGLRHFVHRSGGTCGDHQGETGVHLEAKDVMLKAALAAWLGRRR